jgi:hypothetical protein
MTVYGRSSRWAAALVLALVGLIGGSAATTSATPAAAVPNAFQLTLEGRLTLATVVSDEVPEVTSRGTFSSRAPFCARGTFVDLLVVPTIPIGYRRFTCEDGSGSLTVDFGTTEVWRPWGARWVIFDGTGSYAQLRGRGSLRGEVLGGKIDPQLGGAVTWRSTLEGVVDRDAVAPTITLSRATATKLRRPAGAFTIRLLLALRDDVDGRPVYYTLRVATLGGTELARRFGMATTPALPLTLRINPRNVRVNAVWLELDAEDPIGNASSLSRWLKLPR